MKTIKSLTLVIMIIAISVFHLNTGPSQYALHIFHSELFFVPIILASLWFGLAVGLGTALLVCLIYAPLFLHGGDHGHGVQYSVLFAQLFMYLCISALIGWLNDRHRAQQKRISEGERLTALSKAAATLSFELKFAITGIGNILKKVPEIKNTQQEQLLKGELDNLNRIVEVLTSFVPTQQQVPISEDLNQLIDTCKIKFSAAAREKGVQLVAQKDPTGCPSMIVSESIARVLDNLVENAIEASPSGSSIQIRSLRGNTSCLIEVQDEGTGVTQENRRKLFTPFFTTKRKGSGLALAAGRKVLRDHGGDLIYLPVTPHGSIFRMQVPRETETHNLDEYVRNQKLTADR